MISLTEWMEYKDENRVNKHNLFGGEMSESKYNEAYMKGINKGKELAYLEMTMNCADELQFIPLSVLKGIRAEIEGDWQLKEYPNSPFSCGLRRALDIIDRRFRDYQEKKARDKE